MSELVVEGHPDKMNDQILGSILDTILEKEPRLCKQKERIAIQYQNNSLLGLQLS